MTGVRRARSEGLTDRDRSSLASLFREGWPDETFDPDDWDHTFGGVHFLIVDDDGEVLSHAAVVPRELHTGGQRLRTGYVEAVATRSARRALGLGSAVMREAGDHIDRTYDLGALGTGVHGFYERLGWVTWRGPTFVRTDDGDVATPDEDGYVMVRLTPRSPSLDLAAPISCDWRAGDVW